jgi:hypothetical protein
MAVIKPFSIARAAGPVKAPSMSREGAERIMTEQGLTGAEGL